MTMRASTHFALRLSLIAHDLAPAEKVPELEKVATRYAVAITPERRGSDRSLRSARSDRAAVCALSGRTWWSGAGECRPDRRSRSFAGERDCASLSRSRAVQGACMFVRSIAGFASAAKWWGPARRTALSSEAYASALNYIRTHPEIWEVILTGGDPLDVVGAGASRRS